MNKIARATKVLNTLFLLLLLLLYEKREETNSIYTLKHTKNKIEVVIVINNKKKPNSGFV